MNSWPDGYKKAMSQAEHSAWNAYNYPGTLQICFICDEPTERCEEDDIWTEDGDGPFCVNCWILFQIRVLLV